MEQKTPLSCALLDGERQRVARGRYDFPDDETRARFNPASTVTPEQMASVAFLWPDDGDTIPVSNVQPSGDGIHYEMRVEKAEG